MSNEVIDFKKQLSDAISDIRRARNQVSAYEASLKTYAKYGEFRAMDAVLEKIAEEGEKITVLANLLRKNKIVKGGE